MLTEQEVEYALDACKSKAFLGNNAAFLGSLLCSMEILWSEENNPTAKTNGLKLWWNRDWFISLPKESRVTVLVHELWHTGRLHFLRRGNRDAEIWNYACDIRINNDLKAAGYSFKNIEWAWLMPEVDVNGIMAEEDIYDLLIQQNLKPPPQPGSGGQGAAGANGDMTNLPQGEDSTSGAEGSANQVKILEAVVRAVQAAERANQAGNVPGGTKDFITQFLTPVVPWEATLMQFFTDLGEYRYTWARPNRRYSDDYRQSIEHESDRLEHLIYYLDVSGSITDKDRLRFNSEVKYIKDVLNPRKLTLVQFDTEIQHEHVFEESDPFEKVVDVSGGGTCLICVKNHIEQNNPTAAIIFSDMHVAPMDKPKTGTPIIWIRIGKGHVPSFGKIINIRS